MKVPKVKNYDASAI